MAVIVQFALAFIFIAAVPVRAQDEQGHLSPDYPMQFYWFHTERGIPGTDAASDPRLAQIATALASGDLKRCRELAAEVLDETSGAGDEAPALRAF